MRRKGEGEEGRLQEREKELEMVEWLDTKILAYRDQEKVDQLVRLREINIELKKKLAKIK